MFCSFIRSPVDGATNWSTRPHAGLLYNFQYNTRNHYRAVNCFRRTSTLHCTFRYRRAPPPPRPPACTAHSALCSTRCSSLARASILCPPIQRLLHAFASLPPAPLLAMSEKIVLETAPYDPRFSSTVDQSKVRSTSIQRGLCCAPHLPASQRVMQMRPLMREAQSRL